MKRREFFHGLGGAAAWLAFPHMAVAAHTDNLPDAVYYSGMEDSAPWRREAQKRIEKYRKGKLSLLIRDRSGKAVRGVSVSGKLVRHDFNFGAALRSKFLFGNVLPHKTRENLISFSEDMFNTAVPTNSLKWRHYQKDRVYTDKLLQWAREKKMNVRGHCLVWGHEKRLPDDMKWIMRSSPKTLRDAITKHITTMLTQFGEYGDPITEWDVLNEPYSQSQYMRRLGKGVAVEWFALAAKLQPRMKRYVNDYGIVMNRPHLRRHQRGFYDYVRWMVKSKADFNGIGFQGHLRRGNVPTAPELVYKNMNRYAPFKKDLQMTEVDYDTENESLQARYLHDLMLTAYSHPLMRGFITWLPFAYAKRTMIEKPHAPLVTHDFRLKENGRAWNEMVKKILVSSPQGASNGEGAFAWNGFYGDYVLRLSKGGQEKNMRFSFRPDQKQYRLTL